MDKKTIKSVFDFVSGLFKKSRTPIPILDCVLIEQKNGKMSFTMSDVENSVTVMTRGSFDDFRIALPQDQMKGLLKSISYSLDFGTDGDRVVALSDSDKINLECYDVENFPIIEPGEMVPCDLPELATGLKVVYAANIDDSRFNLNTVNVDVKNGLYRYVSTDGHRLSYYSVANEISSPSFLIPMKAAKFLISQKFCSLGFAKTEINKSYLKISGETLSGDFFEILIRLVEGDYPDYTKVLPTTDVVEVTFDKSQMLEALKKIIPIAYQKKTFKSYNHNDSPDNQVIMMMSMSDEIITLSDKFEKVVLRVSATSNNSQDVELRLNINYLIDVLHHKSGKKIKMILSKNNGPVVFEGDNFNEYDIIMPMRK